MKKLLTSLLLLLLLTGSYGQLSVDWHSEIHGSDLNNNADNVKYVGSITDSTGNMYVVLQPHIPTFDTTYFMKFDPEGILQYSVVISDSVNGIGSPFTLFFSVDNNLILAYEEYGHGTITKVNPSNGSIFWSTKLPFPVYAGHYFYDIKLGPANNIWALVGFYPGPQSPYEFWFAKIDQNGVVLNTFLPPSRGYYSDIYNFHFNSVDDIIYIQIDGDSIWPPGPSYSSLVKIDSSGSTIKDSVLFPQGKETYLHSTFDHSENIILSGGTLSPNAFSLKKFDSNFNVLWHKTENLGYSAYGKAKVDDNNNIYIYGSRNYRDLGPNDAFLSKYDSAGNKLWQYNHPDVHNEDEWVRDFFIGKDNNLYLFCSIDSAGLTYWYSVIKLDTMGNVKDHWIEDLDGYRVLSQNNSIHYLESNDFIIADNGFSSNPVYYYASIIKLCTDSCKFNVSGTVYFDGDANCMQGGSEPGLAGRILSIDPGNHYTVSDADGQFHFRLPHGSYNLTQSVPPNWSITCPTNGHSFSLNSIDTTELGIMMGTSIPPNTRDLSVGITATHSWLRNDQRHSIRYKNQGSQVESGQVIVTLDTVFDYLNAAPNPATISGNQYFFNYANLLPGDDGVINIETKLDSTAPHFYRFGNSVEIFPNTNDVDISNNSDFDSALVINSIVFRMGLPEWHTQTVQPGIFEEKRVITQADSILVYSLKFINPYDREIEDLIIRDTISEFLDLTTLDVISSSHAYQLDILPNRIAQWTLKDIHLSSAYTDFPGGLGYLKFRIKLSPQIISGDEIKNRAVFYYDYGLPHHTNSTTREYFQRGASIAKDIQNSGIKIYPNPSDDIIFIQTTDPSIILQQIVLYDTQGNQLDVINGSAQTNSISVKHLIPGVYLLKIEFDETFYFRKFIKVSP